MDAAKAKGSKTPVVEDPEFEFAQAEGSDSSSSHSSVELRESHGANRKSLAEIPVDISVSLASSATSTTSIFNNETKTAKAPRDQGVAEVAEKKKRLSHPLKASTFTDDELDMMKRQSRLWGFLRPQLDPPQYKKPSAPKIEVPDTEPVERMFPRYDPTKKQRNTADHLEEGSSGTDESAASKAGTGGGVLRHGAEKSTGSRKSGDSATLIYPVLVENDYRKGSDEGQLNSSSPPNGNSSKRNSGQRSPNFSYPDGSSSNRSSGGPESPNTNPNGNQSTRNSGGLEALNPNGILPTRKNGDPESLLANQNASSASPNGGNPELQNSPNGGEYSGSNTRSGTLNPSKPNGNSSNRKSGGPESLNSNPQANSDSQNGGGPAQNSEQNSSNRDENSATRNRSSGGPESLGSSGNTASRDGGSPGGANPSNVNENSTSGGGIPGADSSNPNENSSTPNSGGPGSLNSSNPNENSTAEKSDGRGRQHSSSSNENGTGSGGGPGQNPSNPDGNSALNGGGPGVQNPATHNTNRESLFHSVIYENSPENRRNGGPSLTASFSHPIDAFTRALQAEVITNYVVSPARALSVFITSNISKAVEALQSEEEPTQACLTPTYSMVSLFPFCGHKPKIFPYDQMPCMFCDPEEIKSSKQSPRCSPHGSDEAVGQSDRRRSSEKNSPRVGRNSREVGAGVERTEAGVGNEYSDLPEHVPIIKKRGSSGTQKPPMILQPRSGRLSRKSEEPAPGDKRSSIQMGQEGNFSSKKNSVDEEDEVPSDRKRGSTGAENSQRRSIKSEENAPEEKRPSMETGEEFSSPRHRGSSGAEGAADSEAGPKRNSRKSADAQRRSLEAKEECPSCQKRRSSGEQNSQRRSRKSEASSDEKRPSLETGEEFSSPWNRGSSGAEEAAELEADSKRNSRKSEEAQRRSLEAEEEFPSQKRGSTGEKNSQRRSRKSEENPGEKRPSLETEEEFSSSRKRGSSGAEEAAELEPGSKRNSRKSAELAQQRKSLEAEEEFQSPQKRGSSGVENLQGRSRKSEENALDEKRPSMETGEEFSSPRNRGMSGAEEGGEMEPGSKRNSRKSAELAQQRKSLEAEEEFLSNQKRTSSGAGRAGMPESQCRCSNSEELEKRQSMEIENEFSPTQKRGSQKVDEEPAEFMPGPQRNSKNPEELEEELEEDQEEESPSFEEAVEEDEVEGDEFAEENLPEEEEQEEQEELPLDAVSEGSEENPPSASHDEELSVPPDENALSLPVEENFSLPSEENRLSLPVEEYLSVPDEDNQLSVPPEEDCTCAPSVPISPKQKSSLPRREKLSPSPTDMKRSIPRQEKRSLPRADQNYVPREEKRSLTPEQKRSLPRQEKRLLTPTDQKIPPPSGEKYRSPCGCMADEEPSRNFYKYQPEPFIIAKPRRRTSPSPASIVAKLNEPLAPNCKPEGESVVQNPGVQTPELVIQEIRRASLISFDQNSPVADFTSGISGMKNLVKARSKVLMEDEDDENLDFIDYFAKKEGYVYIEILETFFMTYYEQSRAAIKLMGENPGAQKKCEEARSRVPEMYKIIQVGEEKQLEDYDFPAALERDARAFEIDYMPKVILIAKLHNYGVQMILHYVKLLTLRKAIQPITIYKFATELIADIVVLCYGLFTQISEFLVELIDKPTDLRLRRFTMDYLIRSFRHIVDCICDEIGAIGQSSAQVMLRIRDIEHYKVLEVLTNIYKQINYANVSIARAMESLAAGVYFYHIKHFV